MNMPNTVKQIINTFHKNGFAAYAVGGCVRDCILNAAPSDWDICTSAVPANVKQIFSKTVDTGIKHGTVTVLLNGESFEITTFRHDGCYKDNRRPEHVEFTKSVTDDLSRRDFTVNAMAYNDTEGLIDPFCGADDIKKRLIRCVGDPDTRFSEDSLRILRAIRFSAQKDFAIEENTLASIKKNAPLVQNLSAERVIAEITKILLSDHPEKIKLLYDIGVLRFIMPQMCKCFETPQSIKWHIYDVGTHSLKTAGFTKKKAYLRYGALLHDWGKPETKGKNPDGSDCFRGHAKQSVVSANEFLCRYKFSNADKNKILRLIQYHDRQIIPEKKYVKRAVNDIGEDIFLDLIELKRADCRAQNFELTAPRLEIYDKIERIYHQMKYDDEAFTLKELALNGNDIKELGFNGKDIGRILKLLLNHVIDRPDDNDAEILKQKIKYFDRPE